MDKKKSPGEQPPSPPPQHQHQGVEEAKGTRSGRGSTPLPASAECLANPEPSAPQKEGSFPDYSQEFHTKGILIMRKNLKDCQPSGVTLKNHEILFMNRGRKSFQRPVASFFLDKSFKPLANKFQVSQRGEFDKNAEGRLGNGQPDPPKVPPPPPLLGETTRMSEIDGRISRMSVESGCSPRNHFVRNFSKSMPKICLNSEFLRYCRGCSEEEERRPESREVGESRQTGQKTRNEPEGSRRQGESVDPLAKNRAEEPRRGKLDSGLATERSMKLEMNKIEANYEKKLKTKSRTQILRAIMEERALSEEPGYGSPELIEYSTSRLPHFIKKSEKIEAINKLMI